jgi:Cdc6-like AAA superfamily ATPase
LENELCRLFELAHRPGHSFMLVGVANQIDFTERHLASLRLQLPNVKPQVIVFKPYSFQTINEILVDRLGGASSAARIVNAHGLSFIARKVAAQSGDVRLALDICRRVLQQKVGELAANGVTDFASPISLIDIVKIIKVVLEGKSKSNVLSLPRNLQMILFATTRLVAQASYVASTSSPTPTDVSSTTHKLYHVDDLYDCYCDVSHDAGVFKPLTRGEFKLGLETLSSEGMIGAHELKKQLLKLLTTPSELLQTFKNDAYFARLL